MNSEMMAFLKVIAEEPADDTSRLVFADWLEEHDQPARAEFIRLQIELSRMDPAEEGYAEKTARMRRCGIFTQPGTQPFFDHVPDKNGKIGFNRGFIGTLDVVSANTLEITDFTLLPLEYLRVGDNHVDFFRSFAKLKWLEFHSDREGSPARLLEILGPGGWFPQLETLSLSYLARNYLEAGVIPQMDLVRLRNFVLSTDSFYNLSVFVENAVDEEDDYGSSRTWTGLADFLPRNAIPSKRSPLERFVWHTDDDSDNYRDDRFWAGPTMESLLEHLKIHKLKQVEVAVDWDDHEGGGEGVDAAIYERNPLELCPTLEHVTLERQGMLLLTGKKKKLRSLRVYEAYHVDDSLVRLLAQPLCSELESLHVEIRAGGADQPLSQQTRNFAKLRSLSGLGFTLFSNCSFPNLLKLSAPLSGVMERKWPKLQMLTTNFSKLSELKAFAQSDCCPNLTTLTIEPYYQDYYESAKIDFSFLADCPHMPHLSLIHLAGYPRDRSFIVDGGKLLPVRGDILIEELKPSTVYRISEVF